MPGPVVAGILAVASAEDVLRHGFEAAHDRDVPLHVLVAGPAAVAGQVDDVHEVIGRWSQKYPVVPVTVSVRAGLDAVIVLAAASSGGGLLVAAETHGSREDAIIRALRRRVRCPLAIPASTGDLPGRPRCGWPPLRRTAAASA